jgi:hexosaminidase
LGKEVIGWDEILEPNPSDLPPETIIQSWRNMRGAMTAARNGLRAIVSPVSFYYLDHLEVE